MAIRKIITATVDVSRAEAFDTKTNRVFGSADRVAYLHDQLLLRFAFKYSEDDGATWSPYPIPETATLTYAMKDPDELDGTEFLAYASNSAWNVSGDWASADRAQGNCCVRVQTDTANMEAFLATATDAVVDVVEEVEMQEVGEDPVTLLHGRFGMRPDAIRGTEGDPAPTQPPYALQSYVDAAVAQYFQRDADGGLWIVIDGIRVHKFEKP